jgi:predicted DNA-binding transcriptional regulator AlpA
MARPRPSRPAVTFEDGYLRLRDLATYSGLSRRTLCDYLRDPLNPLPHYRVGRFTLVRRSEYDAWAKAFKVATTPTDVDAIVEAMVRR